MTSATVLSLLAFAAIASTCPAQTMSLGVAGGAALTRGYEPFSSSYSGLAPNGQPYVSTFESIATRGWILGPKIGLGVTRRLSVSVEALHRELGVTDTTVFTPPVDVGFGTVLSRFSFTRVDASWEIPVTARYRLTTGGFRPFVDGGASLRPAGTGTGLSHIGFTTGGGVEWGIGDFRISPGLRYTRWKQLGQWEGARLNQAEFLVGVDHVGDVAHPIGVGRKLSFGIIGGIAPGDDLRRAYDATSLLEPEANGLVAGLMVESQLLGSLFLEADGLYRPRHATDWSLQSADHVRFAVLTWEFPVLAKYRVTNRATRPFVEAGPTFRASGNLNGAKPSPYGVTAGAGIESRIGRISVATTVRYTRWGDDRVPGILVYPRTHRNQMSLLLSLFY